MTHWYCWPNVSSPPPELHLCLPIWPHFSSTSVAPAVTAFTQWCNFKLWAPPQTNVPGPPAYLRRAVAVGRFLAPEGIDHFGAPFPSCTVPSTPLRRTGLKVGRLNPARGYGGALSALPVAAGASPSILLHFEDLKTPLITSKMCIVLCTWFVLPCPFLPQQSSEFFLYFVSCLLGPPVWQGLHGR